MTKKKATKEPRAVTPSKKIVDRAARNEKIIALIADGARVKDAAAKFQLSTSGISRILANSGDKRLAGYFASTVADDACDERADRMGYELKQAKRYRGEVIALYRQHDVETIAKKTGLSLRVTKAAVFLAIEAGEIEGPFASAA